MSLAITSISMSGININLYYKLCKCILEIHMTDRAAYSFINGWLAGLLHARQHQLNDCTECVEIQHRTATGLPKGKRSSVHSTTLPSLSFETLQSNSSYFIFFLFLFSFFLFLKTKSFNKTSTSIF